jgi:hypothetical protein
VWYPTEGFPAPMAQPQKEEDEVRLEHLSSLDRLGTLQQKVLTRL